MSRFTLSFTQKHLLGAAWHLTKGTLMVTGLIALVAWEVQTFSYAKAPTAAARADLTPPLLSGVQPVNFKADTATHAEDAAINLAALGNADVYQRIATFLAKKYLVSAEATQLLVSAAFLAGKETGVDPALILSVMAIESRFHPFAESPMGAKGLMQVIPRYHMDKFDVVGGKDAVLNPMANIKVGAMILKEYIQRFGGLEAGLKAYSGATGSDNGYASKVIAERDRLVAAGTGKLVYTIVTAPAAAAQKPAAVTPPVSDGVIPGFNLPANETKPAPLSHLAVPHPEGV